MFLKIGDLFRRFPFGFPLTPMLKGFGAYLAMGFSKAKKSPAGHRASRPPKTPKAPAGRTRGRALAAAGTSRLRRENWGMQTCDGIWF